VAGQPATPTSFKVTGALTVAEPVTGAPTFTWGDDSSEDQYLVEVFDSFGQRV
jgi:hypothetical protein